MKNVNMVEMILGLQKKGVYVHLTAEGIAEFLRLIQEEVSAIKDLSKAV